MSKTLEPSRLSPSDRGALRSLLDALHGPSHSTNTTITVGNPTGDFSDGFHVFRLDWNETGRRWFVDDLLFRETPAPPWFSEAASSPAPFNERFHIIRNLAVEGNWPGSPDKETVFPQQMLVDWVKIYQ